LPDCTIFDWISNCADGVIFSGCIFNCLFDFTNLFNTMIVTTKISREHSTEIASKTKKSKRGHAR
jgi:hypothetical protein